MIKSNLCLAFALLMYGWSFDAHAAPISVHDFAQPYEMSDATLSPDGRTLAFIGRVDERSTLYFRDLETQKMRRIDPAAMNDNYPGKKEITRFWWVSDKRVVFESDTFARYILGLSAVDRNATNWIGVSGTNREQNKDRTFWNDGKIRLFGWMNHVYGDKSGRVYLIQASDWEGNSQLMSMDTNSGRVLHAVKGPRGITTWVFNRQDRPCLGIKLNGRDWTTVYQSEKEGNWVDLPDLSSKTKSYYPLGFEKSGTRIYVAGLTKTGTWGVYLYNLDSRQIDGMVVENPDFDIINPHSNSGGVGLLYDRASQNLVGIRYMTDWLQTLWLDPNLVAVQKATNRVLPHTNNLLSNWDDQRTKFLVLAVTERNAGTYYLFDLAQHSFAKLGDRAPWLKPEEMGDTYPITFQARDGMKLHGYLTYPPGKARKNLPLVVYPHGGPFLRNAMGYDPMLQFMASRGYAVLQVNYRGSTGYGESYYVAGWKEVGKKIQDDITDGVKAMIAGGVADPHRIAIVGASYGGYSVLWALENTPELYRCGISLAGVTDWNALIGRASKKVRLGEHMGGAMMIRRYWEDRIGDAARDEESLKAISPLYHAEKLRKPVLIVQGTEDRTVPDSQAKAMVKALEAHGADYEAWFVKGEGHSYFHPKEREELFQRVEAFLAKHMK